MAARIWIVKFYATQEDYDNKNPFHKTELVGDEADIKEKAEALKEELKAAAYKIKEREI